MAKTIHVDTKTFIRFWLVIAVLVVLAALLAQASTALIIIGIAIFLAIAITPLMKKIDKLLFRKKSHPGLSAGIAVGGLAVIFILIIAIAGPLIVTQTSDFISNLPEQVQDSLANMNFVDDIGNKLGIDNAKVQITNFVKNSAQDLLGSIPQTLFNSVGAVTNFVTALALTIVLTVLFMTQGPQLLNSIMRKFDEKHGQATKLAKDILDKIANVISSYVTGQLMVAVIDGVVVGLVVFLLSLIFGFSSSLAIPMGLLALVFYMIPMFGPVITAVLVTALLFFSNPWAALCFVVFYPLFEQIQGNVIGPKVQGNHMSLPPLVILISITLGMYMFGLLGALISIPTAGIIKVLIDEYPKMRKLAEKN